MGIGERIKRARKNAGLTQEQLATELDVTFQAVSSWETDSYIPDTVHLIELAKILNVSVSSIVEDKGGYDFVTKDAIYNWEHMRTFVKSSANALKLKNTLKAVDFAVKAHKGQLRKNSDIPYIYHPLNMACHCLAMGIRDDHIVAACLLHDVIEDTAYTKEDLLKVFDPETVELVCLMTHDKDDDRRDEIMQKYFKSLAKNPKAVLIKCIDRCNNFTTMAYGLSRDKIYRYIREGDLYVLPLLKTIKNEYNDAAWLLSYQIQSTLDIYKRLM
ncbi:MAG: helix-turn-helix domain-containing protein [Erysipelotrichaceae bacterium]|nr:helix-turn-helix domain-containing protein [Erysipelotrichaceae bacterium]